jgi:NADP-dependent 3-hydroxy acid dehydrogenase YdfG
LSIGSSIGLGFAIAKAYAEEGAYVALTSRDLKRAEEAAKQIPNAKPFAADLLVVLNKNSSDYFGVKTAEITERNFIRII